MSEFVIKLTISRQKLSRWKTPPVFSPWAFRKSASCSTCFHKLLPVGLPVCCILTCKRPRLLLSRETLFEEEEEAPFVNTADVSPPSPAQSLTRDSRGKKDVYQALLTLHTLAHTFVDWDCRERTGCTALQLSKQNKKNNNVNLQENGSRGGVLNLRWKNSISRSVSSSRNHKLSAITLKSTRQGILYIHFLTHCFAKFYMSTGKQTQKKKKKRWTGLLSNFFAR